MKKFILTLLTAVLVNLSAFADVFPDKIYAAAHCDLDKKTISQTSEITLYAYGDYLVNGEINIGNGEKITLRLDGYVPPKRGKLNGYYKVTYISPLPDGVSPANYKLTGTIRQSNPKDLGEIAKQAGLTVSGYVLKVPGFSQAVAAAKGLLLPDENEGRIKSAAENVYKSTPLTYVEKGDDFNVHPDELVLIKLRPEQ